MFSAGWGKGGGYFFWVFWKFFSVFFFKLWWKMRGILLSYFLYFSTFPNRVSIRQTEKQGLWRHQVHSHFSLILQLLLPYFFKIFSNYSNFKLDIHCSLPSFELSEFFTRCVIHVGDDLYDKILCHLHMHKHDSNNYMRIANCESIRNVAEYQTVKLKNRIIFWIWFIEWFTRCENF